MQHDPSSDHPAASFDGAGISSTGEPQAVERVLDALRQVDDPEVGMNIVELGLVYGVDAGPARISVQMTMTSAACPMGEDIVEDALHAIRRAFPGVDDVDVELVWDPPWTPARMSAQARDFFGWTGD